MRVEVFYVRDCPNHERAVELLRDVLRAGQFAENIQEIEIKSVADAMQMRFLGSPTIRINGVDVEPSAHDVTNYGVLCRTYEDGSTRSGLPPLQLIRDALRKASEANL